jgi:hypothetical protein
LCVRHGAGRQYDMKESKQGQIRPVFGVSGRSATPLWTDAPFTSTRPDAAGTFALR